MSQCAILAAESVAAGQCVGVPLGQACGDLLELLRTVSDGRSDQGRDHPVAAVLAAAAATVAGMNGYRAIAGWVADVPTEVLAELYLRAGAVPAGPPGRTTIWRVLPAPMPILSTTPPAPGFRPCRQATPTPAAGRR